MTVKLAAFDEKSHCPKCWHDDVSTVYHVNAHGWACVLRHSLREPECCTTEHLCRRCGRCSFVWPQAVAAMP